MVLAAGGGEEGLDFFDFFGAAALGAQGEGDGQCDDCGCGTEGGLHLWVVENGGGFGFCFVGQGGGAGAVGELGEGVCEVFAGGGEVVLDVADVAGHGCSCCSLGQFRVFSVVGL